MKEFYKNTVPIILSVLCIFSYICSSAAAPDKVPAMPMHLEDCLDYALHNAPVLQQALIDETLAYSETKDKLAFWMPQIHTKADFTHTFQRFENFINRQIIRFGPTNFNSYGATLSQNIFSAEALLALRTYKKTRKAAQQNTKSVRIALIVQVSKAFYEVLRAQQHIKVVDNDVLRLEKNLSDISARYEVGLIDPIDAKRAAIALNNICAEQQNAAEILKIKYAALKDFMGYRDPQPLQLAYDSLQLEQKALLKPEWHLASQNRIEYQQLLLQKELQTAYLRYQKERLLPTLSLDGQYQVFFQESDNQLKALYKTYAQNSFVNLSVSFPVFQGFTKQRGAQQAKWRLHRLDWDIARMNAQIQVQFQQAAAVYQTDVTNYNTLKENLKLAQEVYSAVYEQYRSGITTYLDVIVAETDLRSARINYTNALFLLLSDKIEVRRALGLIE